MTSPEANGSGRKDRGFILVVVIWIGLLMALMLASFSGSVRNFLRVTTNAAASAQAEAAADAGFSAALLDLTRAAGNTEAARRFPLDGTVRSCALPDGTSVRLVIEDEAGKIALNAAGEGLLTAFFAGLGAEPADARRFAQRVIDYRDADSMPLPDGAESEAYAAQGLRPPKNGSFETAGELARVIGLPTALVARAVPHLSAHSAVDGIDPAVASKVLTALMAAADDPGGLSAAVRSSFSSRSELPAQFSVKSQESAFRVLAEGRSEGGAVFVREAVVELSKSRPGAYLIKAWHRGEVADAGGTPAPAVALGPC